jgi:hypothetical protein
MNPPSWNLQHNNGEHIQWFTSAVPLSRLASDRSFSFMIQNNKADITTYQHSLVVRYYVQSSIPFDPERGHLFKAAEGI